MGDGIDQYSRVVVVVIAACRSCVNLGPREGFPRSVMWEVRTHTFGLPGRGLDWC